MLLKFVSINVWEGGRVMDHLLPWLREQAPDLLFVQEAYGGTDPALEPRLRTVQVLSSELGLPHSDFARNFRSMDAGGVDQGCAVFSKFPITGRQVTFFISFYRPIEGEGPKVWASLPKSLQHLVLETPAGRVNAINIHGPWDMDGDRDSRDRRKMVQAIIRSAGRKERVIAAGDSNAKQTNPALRPLDEKLQSVFGHELKTSELMYVSRDVRVVEHECPDVDISDHLPLVATLEI